MYSTLTGFSYCSAKLRFDFAIERLLHHYPNSKVLVATMGPIWDRQDPGGPHVDPTDLNIWEDEFT